MASPVLPLIVLLLCLVPELVKPGSGIAAGLQVPCCIEKLKNLAEKFGWEEFVTLSRCRSEIKTEGWAFHARLEFMNPSAILIVACAVAVRWARLWD